jgi:hypothetical protein
LRALDYALLDNHAFLTTSKEAFDTMDRLHAYGYFLEGLLPVVGWMQPAEALTAGIEKMSSQLRRIAPMFARSDVYAQLLRLRLAASALGLQLDEASAAEEVGAIREFQMDSDHWRQRGGFAFGRRAGVLMPFVNPASTAFCVQALTMWERRGVGQLEADWRAII